MQKKRDSENSNKMVVVWALYLREGGKDGETLKIRFQKLRSEIVGASNRSQNQGCISNMRSFGWES
jgi:hypothetical protein